MVNIMSEKARKLRLNMTVAERKLWRHLREIKHLNLNFRKQAPIGPYIVDFVSYTAKIIIEVDGGQHNHNENIEYDRKRTIWLEDQGYSVKRFWNNEVLENIEGVMSVILNTVAPDEYSYTELEINGDSKIKSM